MGKNNKGDSHKISEKANAIFEQYQSDKTSADDFIFPELKNNTHDNKFSIQKTIASGDKIDIRMLQRLYRHSSITTPIGYQSNFIHQTADDALEKVLGL